MEATEEQSRLELLTSSLQDQLSKANQVADEARRRAKVGTQYNSSKLEKEKQDAVNTRQKVEAQLTREKQAHGDAPKAILTASITGEVISLHIILMVLVDDVPLFESPINVTPGITRNRLVPGGSIDIAILDKDLSNAELLRILRAQHILRANSLGPKTLKPYVITLPRPLAYEKDSEEIQGTVSDAGRESCSTFD